MVGHDSVERGRRSFLLMKRLGALLQIRANKAMDAAEDPRDMLDHSYDKQLEMLRNVKRGVVEVTAAKRRLELRANELQGEIGKFDDQARQAMAAGREDLARLVLERKQSAMSQLDDFRAQVAQLEGEQQRLVTAESRLQAKVESFRTRKEVMKAQYSAAEATVRVGESISGISEEMGDVGAMMRRAEDRTEQLRSRGDAIGELLESGVLEDQLGPGQSPLDRELAQITSGQQVELEMEQLRRELGPAPAPKQLESPQ